MSIYTRCTAELGYTISSGAEVVLLPDAGPLITLAYADALDVLLLPGWAVQVVDMVLHEVTRNQTPNGEKMERWVAEKQLPILPTQCMQRYQQAQLAGVPRKNNLGELAIQELMNSFAFSEAATRGVFLFEDHKIARTSFLLPDNCSKVSTWAFLQFLGQKGWLESVAEIERQAVLAGREFSRLRFPP